MGRFSEGALVRSGSSGSRAGWWLIGAFTVVSLALACGTGSGGSTGGGDGATTSIVSPTPFAHPVGYAAADLHGYDTENQVLDCRQCHGALLDGGTSAVDCDTCHAASGHANWRTDCVYCHGGTDNVSGAPPRELAGSTTFSFNKHTKHMAGTYSVVWDCNQCHRKPTDVLSGNHMLDGTRGRAEVDFSTGLSQFGFYSSGQQCSNLWCHGTGKGDDGSYSGQQAFGNACESCHHTTGPTSLGGDHPAHLQAPRNIACGTCHGNVVTGSTTINNKTLHINRVINVQLSGGYNLTTHTGCTGNCHGVKVWQ